METTTKTVELRTLTARPGMMLTTDAAAEHPYFTERVYLGAGDDGSRWHEIPAAEAEAIMAAKAEEARLLQDVDDSVDL